MHGGQGSPVSAILKNSKHQLLQVFEVGQRSVPLNAGIAPGRLPICTVSINYSLGVCAAERF